MWQKIQDEVGTGGFVVLAVAMDTPEAARPWIEAARPTYPCLIDRDHYVADLYDMVNVPQAVWIDEAGRVVRPPENAGATDTFRRMDRATRSLSPEQIAEREETKAAYVAAVRDWALNGARSPHALDPLAARARVAAPDPAIALAHAHFRLGQHLLRAGNADEAQRHFAEASRLHPESWNIWRQTAAKEATGFASGPAFWARVDALGEKPYYRPTSL